MKLFVEHNMISFCRWSDMLCKIICTSSLVIFLGGFPLQADESKQLEFFESRIRPVLVKHCYECHSSEKQEAKGGLVVDSSAGLLKGGESGPSIVPGKPSESLLVEALQYDGLEMPPSGRLPKRVVEDFTKWIRSGAIDPRKGPVLKTSPAQIDIEEGRKFWAFQPIKKYRLPKVSHSEWPISPLDHFILARLEDAQLTPAPQTDRRVLIRRLYFDLIGLPPEPEDVDAFVKDLSEDAYPQLVDALLESPQFGIHWGRHWLDVARYADSNGGDFNATFHNAWRYRDYVVEALNNDKPYHQFIQEQIAGDLLSFQSDEQRAEQLVATGFLMLGTKMLSERDKEKLRMDVVDEQINTIGSAFMGMTLGCARCHDHKFDPIPTADYYALAGILRSTKTLEGESQKFVSTWKRRNLPADPAHVLAVEKFNADKKTLKKQMDTAEQKLEQAKQAVKHNHNKITVDNNKAIKNGDWVSSVHMKGYVGADYLHDDNLEKGAKSLKYLVPVKKTARYEVRLSYTSSRGRARRVPVTVQHAEGETIFHLNQELPPKIDKQYASIGQFNFDATKQASITISNKGTAGYVIADSVQFVEVDTAGKPVVIENLNDKQRLQSQKQLKQAMLLLKTLKSRQKKLEASSPKPLPQAFAADDFEEIGDCKICIRGEHKNLGSAVKRGFLQVAKFSDQLKFNDQQSGRRQLADWLTHPNHPLTSRVIANRIWYHLLGEGIVASLDNFGRLGERPTHPKLLDFLAWEFVEDGWSVKRAIRRIVLSRTYQMSSNHRDECWKTDPENKLYWRARRRRLPAESIRDSMLSLSGQLDITPGKSPVKGLGTLVTTNSANAKQYNRKETTKRSLYLPIIRNELPPILTLFDFADPDLVTGKRAVTNVPAQALLLMNSPFIMNCSDKVASKLLSQYQTNQQQVVEEAYRLILSRAPSDSEKKRAYRFLEPSSTPDNKEKSAEQMHKSVSQLVHVLFASTEFRMQN